MEAASAAPSRSLSRLAYEFRAPEGRLTALSNYGSSATCTPVLRCPTFSQGYAKFTICDRRWRWVREVRFILGCRVTSIPTAARRFPMTPPTAAAVSWSPLVIRQHAVWGEKCMLAYHFQRSWNRSHRAGIARAGATGHNAGTWHVTPWLSRFTTKGDRPTHGLI